MKNLRYSQGSSDEKSPLLAGIKGWKISVISRNQVIKDLQQGSSDEKSLFLTGIKWWKISLLSGISGEKSPLLARSSEEISGISRDQVK